MSKSKLFTPSIDIDCTPDVKNQLRSAAPMLARLMKVEKMSLLQYGLNFGENLNQMND